jgi:hypothetical protein
MRVKYSFRSPRIDVEAYRKTLDKQMKEALAQGLMAWLDAVLVEIPDWSGASRATFIQLASLIGHNVDAGGGAAPFNRVGEGISNGQGEMTTDQAKGLYTFTYGTTLPWLVWNEYHNANTDPDPTKWPSPSILHKPGPYRFQDKGARAFQKIADSVQLPKVAPFIKSSPVRS